MGFLDKVKEKAAEAIEQGKDVAQGAAAEAAAEEARGRRGRGARSVRQRGLHAVRGGHALDVVRPRRGRGAHPHAHARRSRPRRPRRRQPARTPTTTPATRRLARPSRRLAARLARRGHAHAPGRPRPSATRSGLMSGSSRSELRARSSDSMLQQLLGEPVERLAVQAQQAQRLLERRVGQALLLGVAQAASSPRRGSRRRRAASATRRSCPCRARRPSSARSC